MESLDGAPENEELRFQGTVVEKVVLFIKKKYTNTACTYTFNGDTRLLLQNKHLENLYRIYMHN